MFLVFDIGGTKTRIAISDGTSVNEPSIFPTPQGYQEGLEIFRQFLDQHPTALAGGIGGPLQHDKQELEASPQLPDWVDKPLKQDLEKMFNVPVLLENDAALAGLGEATHGAGKGYSIIAYLTISTGVGGAKIESGKIDKNTHGFEPGQMVIGDGKLADLISSIGLEKKYGMKPEDIEDQEVWDKTAEYLAQGLNNIIVDWSPEVIVLGGGVISSISLDKVTLHLKKIMKVFPDIPPIVKAKLGDQSGLYGALEYLKQRKGEKI